MNKKDVEYLIKYLDPNLLDDGLKELEKGKPVQYIVGNVDFYGNKINVNESVLIPRFETELLVEKTIKYINSFFNEVKNIIDLGTGSGCIAITLKKEICCNVVGVDISNEALCVARNNADMNNLDIKFINSNMLDDVDGLFDVIISNPPYIRYDEKIDDIVKNNEPALALYADNDGLYFYDYILKSCKKNLNKRSLIAFEIGMNQGISVKNLAIKYFPKSRVSVEKDYNDRDRFVFIFNE